MKPNLKTFPELKTPYEVTACHKLIWDIYEWKQHFEDKLQQLKQKARFKPLIKEPAIAINEILGDISHAQSIVTPKEGETP